MGDTDDTAARNALCVSPAGHFLNGFVVRWDSEGQQGCLLRDKDQQWMAEAGFAAPPASQSSYHWQAPNDMTMYRFMLKLFGFDKHPALTDMQIAWRKLGWHADEQACKSFDYSEQEYTSPQPLFFLVHYLAS